MISHFIHCPQANQHPHIVIYRDNEDPYLFYYINSHPRIKIDEPKTPYPDGDESDLYQEGINKLNEIKPTEELLNDVVNSLMEKDEEKKKNLKTNQLKKKAYGNEFTNALKFYNENKEKFEELTGERKICLQNTLINKFHKEVRNLSKGKNKNNKEG